MNRFLYLLTAAILIVTGLGASPTANAFSITRNGDPQALVQKLLGPGVTVIGTPRLIGSFLGAGTFSDGATVIGIDSGIVFSSGLATCAAGSNASQGAETLGDGSNAARNNCSGSNRGPSVPEIPQSVNAAGLEFEFQLGDGSQSGTVFVNYVWFFVGSCGASHAGSQT